MKKDIDFPKVEQVGICAIPQENEGKTLWKVYIINMLDKAITNVLVSTRGYGKHDKQEIKTSELRHYFEEIQPHSDRAIEVIPEELIGLNNQYWVSFYVGRTIFDRKFIFLPDTLLKKNLTSVPILNKQGILII